MHPQAEAEVTLQSGAHIRAAPVENFHFIIGFGEEGGWSAQVLPSGTAHLVLGRPERVHLRFAVPGAAAALEPGKAFDFFEVGRRGVGRILRVLPSTPYGSPYDVSAFR